MMKNLKKKSNCPPFPFRAGKTIDSHSVPIPTLCRDNSGTPTLRRTQTIFNPLPDDKF